MKDELKPCKKHNRMPYLKEITTEPWHNTISSFGIKRFEYVCDACELEKEIERKRPLIDEWNKKQENS